MSPSRSGSMAGGACERAGCTLALLCVALAACACACADKRAEMLPMPFVLGSRYGRSPPRMIAPRNDRFFMGSRYGKRSEPGSDEYPPGRLSAGGLAQGGTARGGLVTLQCDYTGLGALYRCRHAPPAPPAPPAHNTLNENRNPKRAEDEFCYSCTGGYSRVVWSPRKGFWS